MSNKYNNSKHDAEHSVRRGIATNEHGELRRGRLSMIKNNNPTGGLRENEFQSGLEQDENGSGNQNRV